MSTYRTTRGMGTKLTKGNRCSSSTYSLMPGMLNVSSFLPSILRKSSYSRERDGPPYFSYFRWCMSIVFSSLAHAPSRMLDYNRLVLISLQSSTNLDRYDEIQSSKCTQPGCCRHSLHGCIYRCLPTVSHYLRLSTSQ